MSWELSLTCTSVHMRVNRELSMKELLKEGTSEVTGPYIGQMILVSRNAGMVRQAPSMNGVEHFYSNTGHSLTERACLGLKKSIAKKSINNRQGQQTKSTMYLMNKGEKIF